MWLWKPKLSASLQAVPAILVFQLYPHDNVALTLRLRDMGLSPGPLSNPGRANP